MRLQVHPYIVGAVQFEILEAYPTVGDEVVGWQCAVVEQREAEHLSIVDLGLDPPD